MATRGAYFIAGFTIAAWAPLVPYLKMRCELSDGTLGLLLLCLGLGSVITMPLTGMLTSRFGCRNVIIALALLGCITLPILAATSSLYVLALTLLCFGAASGGLDVASCVQAVFIQNATGRQVMSSMLAFYSIGCIAGPALVSLLLYLEMLPVYAALCASAVIFCILLLCQRNLTPKQESAKQSSSLTALLPKGIVLLFGCMCFTIFLVEGAMMDWGALFLVNYKGFDNSYGGIAFAVFSAALALGRLMGAWLINRVGGERRMIVIGCITSFCGFVLTLFVLPKAFSLLGFFIIGFGNANVIPLIFAATGKQKAMPTSTAISAVTTLGYSGILIGPVFIGFLAELTSLLFAFAFLGVAMLIVALLSGKVAPPPTQEET